MIVPLLLRWKYETIVSPIHIVFFELLMGPICSVAYEKEPMEKNSMNRKPRNMHKNLFSLKELSGSITQGLVILFGTLVVLEFSIKAGYSENLSRSLVFITLIAANVFLALSDRSRKKLITNTIKIPNSTLYFLLSACLILLIPIMLIDFLKILFEVDTPSVSQILISLLAAFISVSWFELAKAYNKKEAS
jgi:P-type Ca2+ transporter type 2C